MLVLGELLLEEGHITTGVFFPQVTQLSLMLVIQLRLLVAKVLLLSLDDHMELGLFTFDLFDEFLQVGNLLEVLDLLRCDLLVEQVLLFLVSDLVLELALAHVCRRFRIQIVTLALLRDVARHI